MRIKCVAILGILLIAGLAHSQENTVLKDLKDKVSYSLGTNIGNNLKNLPTGVNLDLFVKGINDVLSGTKPLMTDQEIRETMAALQREMVARQEGRTKGSGEKNKKEGEAFLAENKGKEGIITLPSGLQYKVLKAGTGKTPTETDTVMVQYRGTLLDGTEYDSSYRRRRATTFQVKGVIPGWSEALKLMQEGAKWQLFIPSHLAYGELGSGNQIGPSATLIIEVELISIQEKK